MTRREQHFILFMLFLALTVVFSSETVAASGLNNPKGSFEGLLDLIKHSAASWDGRLKVYARRLFWLLASIQFIWTFFPLVFRQADFGEMVGELIRFIMVIGFFYALLLFSADWGGALIDSFRQAGATAAGLGTTGMLPGDVFATAVELTNMVGKVETWNPLMASMIGLSALVVMICFSFIAAFMGLTIIESYVVINASVLFMGFGASQWTREYALATVRYAVSVGAKLFVLTLIVGMIVDSARQWVTAYARESDDVSMWTMVGLSLACAYLAKTIPELVAAMISGTSMGGGASIGGMAAAGAAGAAAAIATIATASTGKTGSGGGLASALNASISGSGGASGAGTTGSGAGSGMGSTGSGTGMGGSTTAKSAGAQVGGSASSGTAGSAPQQPHQTGPQGGKQAGNTPPGPSEEPKNNTASGSTSAAISGAADAVTRGMGILAAISVPGMEGAAGLSLGSGAPQPELGAAGDGADTMEVNAPESQNMIRPATANNPPDSSPAPDSTGDK